MTFWGIKLLQFSFSKGRATACVEEANIGPPILFSRHKVLGISRNAFFDARNLLIWQSFRLVFLLFITFLFLVMEIRCEMICQDYKANLVEVKSG